MSSPPPTPAGGAAFSSCLFVWWLLHPRAEHRVQLGWQGWAFPLEELRRAIVKRERWFPAPPFKEGLHVDVEVLEMESLKANHV